MIEKNLGLGCCRVTLEVLSGPLGAPKSFFSLEIILYCFAFIIYFDATIIYFLKFLHHCIQKAKTFGCLCCFKLRPIELCCPVKFVRLKLKQ